MLSGQKKRNSIVFYKYKGEGESQFRHSALLTEEEMENIKAAEEKIARSLEGKNKRKRVAHSYVKLTDEELEEVSKSSNIDILSKFCPFNDKGEIQKYNSIVFFKSSVTGDEGHEELTTRENAIRKAELGNAISLRFKHKVVTLTDEQLEILKDPLQQFSPFKR